ncbi:MAG: OapB/ArvB family protein [Nanoarchaeota archaeon]
MLTLQYIPYSQIQNLTPDQRVHKLLHLVSENKILLIEGKLKKDEEASLISKTMEQIGTDENNGFKGIELATIDPKKKNAEFLTQLRNTMANMLLGDRSGMTVIGPASIVKEIKQDPDKIELFINNISSTDANGNGKKMRTRKNIKRKR